VSNISSPGFEFLTRGKVWGKNDGCGVGVIASSTRKSASFFVEVQAYQITLPASFEYVTEPPPVWKNQDLANP
jgi:hypothetical protein